jgi:hypothetical protein
MSNPAPYPADTRAKGWRFELDHERIRQSDTWALSSPELRPWLLMLWMVAWEQTPCGSLPSEDALIAARIGMPAKQWAKSRDILLRGWDVADDGRRYHATVTERVRAMLAKRDKDAKRAAKSRAESAPVTRDTAVIRGGVTQQSDPSSTPSTKHQNLAPDKASAELGESSDDIRSRLDSEGFKPTAAGAACRAMKSAGLQAVNPGDPRLLALLSQGATLEEFDGIAREAVAGGKGFAWVLAVVQARRADAAAIALAAPVAALEPGKLAAERTAADLAALAAHAEKATTPEAAAARKAAMAKFKPQQEAA